MANTTNFGWETPDDTDLVKDGAAAMRTLGNSIDASFVDLKGGTTGQVLAKASNTDLDFTWSSVDPLTILDAKGDLITATAADTPARLAVGADGTYLQADSSTSTGLKWATVSAGGMTQLATGNLSSGTTTISSIPATYKNLQLVIRDFLPASDGAQLLYRFNSDNGGNYARAATVSTTALYGEDTEATLTAGNSNSTAENVTVCNIYDYANTSTYKLAQAVSFATRTGATSVNLLCPIGVWRSTAAINSISILPSTSTVTSGSYILYGVQ